MLKSLIYKTGKSQWEICRELNWPEAKLSRFVTGRRVPSHRDIEALAKVLSLSSEELHQALLITPH